MDLQEFQRNNGPEGKALTVKNERGFRCPMREELDNLIDKREELRGRMMSVNDFDDQFNYREALKSLNDRVEMLREDIRQSSLRE